MDQNLIETQWEAVRGFYSPETDPFAIELVRLGFFLGAATFVLEADQKIKLANPELTEAVRAEINQYTKSLEGRYR